MRGRRFVIGMVMVVLAVGFTFTTLASVFLFQRYQELLWAQRGPLYRTAATDEEWLAVIAEAKQLRSDPGVRWPELWFPPWVRVVDPCKDGLPQLLWGYAFPSQIIIQFNSLDFIGRPSRIIVSYPKEGVVLVVSDEPQESSPSCYANLLEYNVGSAADQIRMDIAGNICTSIQSTLGGGIRDPLASNLPVSPRAAQAYLEAFCQ